MFANSYGFNRGCGCGCSGNINTCGQTGCGSTCGSNSGSTCGSTCGSNYGMSLGTTSGCGCGFTPTVTPITLPETTNCNHCAMCHEQPVIQPIENRTVRHHHFVPRVYVTNRFTQEEVIEPNNVGTMFGNTPMTTPIFPNYTNYMNTL